MTAFVEDEDIPAYVRLAVFDVYAERHGLTVSEREVLEQELAFDGASYGGGGSYLDVSRAPSLGRTAPVVPARPGPAGPSGGSGGGGGGAAAAVYAQVLVAAAGFGWNQGRQARIARDGDPATVHTDPLTGIETSIDPTELAYLSPAEAKAYVAYFAVHGTPPPAGIDRIEPNPYLDPFGQWRMSDTNEPVWSGQANEPLSPGQYVDAQGRRRWSDTNQLVEHFPNRSQYRDDDGVWRWSDTGEPVSSTEDDTGVVDGRRRVRSELGADARLVREANRLGSTHQRSIDSLTAQLASGDTNPGIGTKHLFNGVYSGQPPSGTAGSSACSLPAMA